jgi:hypothetical protein
MALLECYRVVTGHVLDCRTARKDRLAVLYQGLYRYQGREGKVGIVWGIRIDHFERVPTFDSCIALLPQMDNILRKTCNAQYHRRSMLFAFSVIE